MAMRRGRRGDLGLEVLPLIDLALPEPGGQTLLRDRHKEAASAISDALATSLRNVSRLHGWQTQYAFEAVVVSLGAVRLIKSEDSGLFYFDDDDGEMQPPDFRVVLRDGAHLLVEVKNVAPISWETSVRAKDLAAAENYAVATRAKLLYAHFWSRVGMWTLVSPSIFAGTGTRRRLKFEQAMMANQMAILGDSTLAIEPPLTLSFVMDRAKEKVMVRSENGEDSRIVTIGEVQLVNAGRIITDAIERQLAWFLIWNGRWPQTEEVEFDEDGHLAKVSYVCKPEIPDEEAAHQLAVQGMAVVGELSTLNTRRFMAVTNTDAGGIRALREEPEPAFLARLVPDNYWDRQDRALSLWRFNLVPPSGENEVRGGSDV